MVYYYKELSTNRLHLRKLELTDWKEISVLRSDPNINKYIQRELDSSREAAEAFIQKIREGIDSKSYYYWAINLKESTQLIGTICLWNLDVDSRKAEVGFDLLPEFQRKGYMSESLKSVMDFGIQELGYDVLDAYTHRDNKPSIKLLEGKGFRLAKDQIDEGNPNNVIFEYKKEL